MTEQVEVNENPVSNDHESPQVIKPSNSLQEYQIESSKPSSAANISIQKDPDNNSVLALSKNEVSLQSPPAVFGAVIQKSRTQKPDKVSLVSDFVFGQNLHERVELNKEVDSTSEDDKKTNKTQEAEVSSSSNIVSPTFENLKNEEHGENGKLDESAEDSKRRLIEAAKEYEESRATKRKYDEVDCMTGEENDMNVFQLNLCKLYMYDNAKSNWVEKGRGQLRVNDMDNGKSSRVVMRNNGNLKVILNTKIWSDMKVEKVNEKNVRLTAFEEDSIKVFLILGPVKSMNEFINILQVRIARHKEANKMNSNLEIDDKKVVQLNEEEGTLL
ncbi:ran-binding protein 3-like isoform X2 [Daktulosphaira vitifoliae]|uniref:ran-binding protein 3-like isoform X2 n=1 Tax=Daktulosphaira vitifoliae TaxID=58002 RepID=UPI0021AA7A9A|nr:ran-binding protein 3-like isoform X2 [Daktulosphaira vitifoliae]